MPIPSRDILLRRVDARNYLFGKCDYYPCHSELETCNMCYCIFYPCEDKELGEHVTTRKGEKVWSCMDCSWAHDKKTVEDLKEFLRDGENRKLEPKALYEAFKEWHTDYTDLTD